MKTVLLTALLALMSSAAFANTLDCDWVGATTADEMKRFDLSVFGKGYSDDKVPLMSAEGKDVSIQYSSDAGINIHVRDQKTGVSVYAGGMTFVEYHQDGQQELRVTCFINP